jgi:hypothetical protein
MPTAVSGQQMTLPVSVGAASCLSFGHSAWLTPWQWNVKTLRVAHEATRTWTGSGNVHSSLKSETQALLKPDLLWHRVHQSMM